MNILILNATILPMNSKKMLNCDRIMTEIEKAKDGLLDRLNVNVK